MFSPFHFNVNKDTFVGVVIGILFVAVLRAMLRI